MSQAADMLREFHKAFDDPETVELWKRDTLHREEHNELADALAELHYAKVFGWGTHDGPRRESVARELADVVYVAYGTALTLGIDLDMALAAVHAANMAKLPDCKRCRGDGRRREHGLPAFNARIPCEVCNGTGKGKPVKRESDGKVLKPEGWREPDMSCAVKGSR